MKSEPGDYSIDDLKRDKVGMWDGVRNYQVRNMFRDEFEIGDAALFYHSNAGEETGVVGEMEVVKGAYPDPTQFDLPARSAQAGPKSDHLDPRSNPENPRWLAVDMRFKSKFKRLVTLWELKNDPRFKDVAVVRKGNRLSVTPVSKKHYEAIVRIGNLQ